MDPAGDPRGELGLENENFVLVKPCQHTVRAHRQEAHLYSPGSKGTFLCSSPNFTLQIVKTCASGEPYKPRWPLY
jgi:hypothetical protein